MSNLFEVTKRGTGYIWTDEQKKYIRAQFANGSTASAIAKKFHVSSITITKVLNGESDQKPKRDSEPSKTNKKRGRKSLCPFCRKPIEASEPTVPYKNKTAHKKCFEGSFKVISDVQKEEKEERKAAKEEKKKNEALEKPLTNTQIKQGISEEEFQEKKKYLDYLKSLDVEVGGKVLAISDRYIKNYNYTWNSMYWTLVYLNEIKHKDLVEDVVGIIPYYHSEALRFYADCDDMEKRNIDIDLGQMYKVKTVTVKPTKKKIQTIDISQIGVGGDE